MLIRSQDKMDLVKLDDLGIVEHEDTSVSIKMYHNGVYFKIGKYSSKEKAIKVLDTIQGCYEMEEYTMDYWSGNAQLPFMIKNNKVFQMPPDKEA